MAFFFGCLGVELVLRQERVYELPICTIRCLHMSDSAELFEESLRVEKLTLGSDIVEVRILDDALEMCLGFREEDCCHDDILYLFDAFGWMLVFDKPLACYVRSDVFVFLILFDKTRIMEKAGKLEIFEILSLNSL